MNEDIGLELVKLLLQQKWADETLVSAEITSLRSIVDAVCPSHAPTIEKWIARTDPLPMPNVSAIVPHKDEAMRLLAQVTVADGVVHPDEQQMLKLVAEMLDAN